MDWMEMKVNGEIQILQLVKITTLSGLKKMRCMSNLHQTWDESWLLALQLIPPIFNELAPNNCEYNKPRIKIISEE